HIGRGFVGVLDDVAIYPSVLSDGFILRHAVDGYPVGIRGVVETSMSLPTPGVTAYETFLATEVGDANTSMTYQLSVDGGSTWLYYDNGWTATGGSAALSNDAVTVAEHLSELPIGDETIGVRVILSTMSATVSPAVDDVTIGYR